MNFKCRIYKIRLLIASMNPDCPVFAYLLDAIKAAYKSKPITIIVEEEEDLSQEMKIMLDNRLQEDESTYITSKESVARLKKNYGL
jgi:hypothetical protein